MASSPSGRRNENKAKGKEEDRVEQKGGLQHELIVAAICENKAREVGLAVFEIESSTLHLQQYVENSFTYSISL